MLLRGEIMVISWPEINRLILKNNLKNKITITGFIPTKILPELYSLADVVVYPSIMEIFGMVILEANACEKPIISFKSLGTKKN